MRSNGGARSCVKPLCYSSYVQWAQEGPPVNPSEGPPVQPAEPTPAGRKTTNKRGLAALVAFGLLVLTKLDDLFELEAPAR